MIKKKVTKNVVLSAAELEYLANELKEEIMLLRGQIIKTGNKYIYNKNKKVISFIKNEDYKLEGAQEQSALGEEENPEEGDKDKEKDKEKPNDNEKNIEEIHTESLEIKTTEVSISSSAASRKNLESRKRVSLINLDEETIIFKYCELKAKLENLEEATRNRFLQDSNKEVEATQIINEVKDDANKKIEEISEKRIEENSRFTDEIEKIKNEYNKKIMDLEKKVTFLELENENKEKFLIEKDEKISTLTLASISTSNNESVPKENEINQNLNLVSIEKLKKLEDEISKLKIDLQFKTREAEENDSNFKESRAEFKILQNGIERLNMVEEYNLYKYDIKKNKIKYYNIINIIR